MINIMFICHGNICRSTMAEFVMKDIVAKHGASGYNIVSRATSREEIGSHIHHGTRDVLIREGIPYDKHKVAEQVSADDYEKYDLFIIMDANNAFNLRRIGGGFRDDVDGKVHLLMEYVGEHRDVLDPWYTGDFDATYDDVKEGCEALYRAIKRE